MDFSKVTNFFSDLLGNPFSTPAGQLIGIFNLFLLFTSNCLVTFAEQQMFSTASCHIRWQLLVSVFY